MYLNFLYASDGKQLAKSYTIDSEGVMQKESYPRVLNFNSLSEEVTTIEDIFCVIETQATTGSCLLKGNLDRALQNEPRAGHTNSNEPTELLVIDYDGPPDLQPEALLNHCGLGEIDHIVAYSSSAGIELNKYGYHIFIILENSVPPDELKLWLKQLNLLSQEFKSKLVLNRSKNVLKWPLDIGVCQNDKLIYIAPPVLGPGLACNLSEKRYQLIKKAKRKFDFTDKGFDETTLRQLESAEINRLRALEALPEKSFRTRHVFGEEISVNPDQVTVTGSKDERGFTYLNLNGGDSWAYYYPTTDPKILFNFKDEPNYLLRELAPDYYKQAKETAMHTTENNKTNSKHEYLEYLSDYLRKAEDNKEVAYIAFRDKLTDLLYIGEIDFQSRAHEFYTTSSVKKASDYLVHMGQPVPIVIPTWVFQFRPDLDVFVDIEKFWINQYQPPTLFKSASVSEGLEIPTTIDQLITHVCVDEETKQHFVNWLATIFQKHTRTQTAWIFQGTTGTGKGMLYSRVLKPLIGEDYTREITLQHFEEQFNKFMEQCLLLCIDEVDTDQSRRMELITAKLKTLITESTVPVRSMRSDLREVPNYMNIIMNSNQPNSMKIESNDRRYNVSPYQAAKLFGDNDDPNAFVKNINDELPLFANYLLSLSVDVDRARVPLNNDAKHQLQAVTQTAIEEVAYALQTGDLNYFIEHRPEQDIYDERPGYFNGSDIHSATAYRDLIKCAIVCCETNKPQLLNHRDLYVIFDLLVGKMPTNKIKLNKRLAHEGIQISPHRLGATSKRGYLVTWQATEPYLNEVKLKNEAQILPMKAGGRG